MLFRSLATGGSSNDACFRLFNHWHRIHKPSLVVHYSPPPNRFELIGPNDRIKNYLPYDHWLKIDFYREWICNDFNGEFNAQKNHLAIKQLCQENDIPLVYLDHNQMFIIEEGYEFIPYEYGRDLLHPGESWHRNMRKRVMSMVREL